MTLRIFALSATLFYCTSLSAQTFSWTPLNSGTIRKLRSVAASLNRIGAYVIGVRAAQLAFLFALLEPATKLREYKDAGRNFERLAFLEVLKGKPYSAVFDYYCLKNNVPVGEDYIGEVQQYEREVLRRR